MEKKLFSYNLQLFAEGEDPGADPSEGKDNEPNSKDDDKKEEEKKGEEKEGEKKDDDKSKAKYSDDDLDKILNAKFAKWEKKKEKEIDEAKKLADMNAQQKAEYERDKLQQELEELKAKDTKAKMSATARKMLTAENISVSDELLNLLVTNDAETTKATVDSFTKLYKDAVAEGVKEALKGEPPRTGGKSGGMTKEQILDIKDGAERREMIAKHIDLFK